MNKYDIKKAHRGLYAPSAKDFVLVDVPDQLFIAIDGRGDPNTSAAYAAAVEALYAVAYTIKFASKSALEQDFVVGPLEGLWRAPELNAFVTGDKANWEWTMLIAQPGWITNTLIDEGIAAAAEKKELAAISQLHPRTLSEGTSLQILHIGSYDDEAPTLARLHDEYMPQHGLSFNGDHHEIYLSDVRKTATAKLRTVLRQPVRTAAG